jgi:hypothetical protein
MGFVRRSFLRFLERLPFCFQSRTFTPSEHQLPNKTAANTTRQTLRAEDEVGDGLSGLCPDGRQTRSNPITSGFARHPPVAAKIGTSDFPEALADRLGDLSHRVSDALLHGGLAFLLCLRRMLFSVGLLFALLVNFSEARAGQVQLEKFPLIGS